MTSINNEIQTKIFKAADALVFEGVLEPTNKQVRDKLGGGSLSHISPAMREWKKKRRETSAAALEMPSELKTAMTESVNQLWAVASNLAEEKIKDIETKTEATLAESANELNEALDEIKHIETENERLIDLNKAQGDELQGLRTELAVLQGSTALYEDQIESYKRDLTEARDATTQLQGELMKIANRSKT